MANAPHRLSSYADARQEWLDRYGLAMHNARRWQRFAFIALGISAVSVTGVIVLATQSQIVPYVVEIDAGSAEPIRTYRADELDPTSPAIYRSVLSRWIMDLRLVSSDGYLQRDAVGRVYAFLSESHPAFNAVGEWYRKNVPFARAQDATIVVEIGQVLRRTDQTWQITWKEKPRSRDGRSRPAERWIGTITVARGAVTENTILKNPFGIYMREFDAQRVSES